MIIEKTNLHDLYVIKSTATSDDRGSFMRTYCNETFSKSGLNTDWVQENLSYNQSQGTLRGMHYQQAPYQETKLVQCVHGKIFDVAVDIRPDSKTYKQWYGIELSVENSTLMYIPEGFAHGFQTLTDDATVYYHMSREYNPDLTRGIHYKDPSIGIEWPINISNISDLDKNLPLIT